MTSPRLKLSPWLVLFASLAVTWLAWDHERDTAQEQLRRQFDFALRDTASRIEQRVMTYEQMLRGVQGMFSIVGISEREMLESYVAALQPDANFSGIQAIGIVENVAADRLGEHLGAMRRLGFVDYEIQPDGQREAYAPIVQREPNIGVNRSRLGFDTWSDPVRREAMEKARDSGLPVISGKVQLSVDSGAGAPPGFIMYMPVFGKGLPRQNVAQRRASLAGWVFVSFRVKDVMASLYGELPQGLAFTIYDGVALADRDVLYKSPEDAGAAAAFASNEYLVVGGHTWTLAAKMRKSFEGGAGRHTASVVAVAGVGLGLLLSSLVWLMATGRARALQLAQSMTRDLRAAKEAAEDAQRSLAAQAHNLAQSNADLEQFAYVASHDLRTPLRNIVSYAQLLERRYKGHLGADANDFIDFIVENSKKMTLLISDLLEYSRVSRQAAPLEAVSVARVVHLAMGNLRPDLEGSGAEIRIGALPDVRAVETYLVSLFQNLIGNAVKYRSQERPLQIAIAAERISPDLWQFSLADNGIGIEPAYHDKIFEIFQRLDPAGDAEGTGIGLTLCRRIVHRFGGTIWVESEPGRGSTFCFTLRDASFDD